MDRIRYQASSIESLIKDSTEAARLHGDGKPVDMASISVVSSRQEWSHLSGDFLRAARRAGMVAMLSMTSPLERGEKRAGDAALRLIAFGTPDGRVLCFHQGSLIHEDSEHPVYRNTLSAWAVIPPALRQLLESRSILIVGHDMSRKWTSNLRARGISLVNVLDVKHVFPKFFQPHATPSATGMTSSMASLFHVFMGRVTLNVVADACKASPRLEEVHLGTVLANTMLPLVCLGHVLAAIDRQQEHWDGDYDVLADLKADLFDLDRQKGMVRGCSYLVSSHEDFSDWGDSLWSEEDDMAHYARVMAQDDESRRAAREAMRQARGEAPRGGIVLAGKTISHMKQY